MQVKLIRIGNSRGIRFPADLLRLYRLSEGDSLEIEERREGILLRVVGDERATLDYPDAYSEAAAEQVERAEWEEWDQTAGDAE